MEYRLLRYVRRWRGRTGGHGQQPDYRRCRDDEMLNLNRNHSEIGLSYPRISTSIPASDMI